MKRKENETKIVISYSDDDSCDKLLEAFRHLEGLEIRNISRPKENDTGRKTVYVFVK